LSHHFDQGYAMPICGLELYHKLRESVDLRLHQISKKKNTKKISTIVTPSLIEMDRDFRVLRGAALQPGDTVPEPVVGVREHQIHTPKIHLSLGVDSGFRARHPIGHSL
jgi:hypothetical protein